MNNYLNRNKALLLSYISLIGVFMVFFQITLGGTVRVTESGLGCPSTGTAISEWPLCGGEIIPDFDFHTAIEWGHRVSGASIGLLIIFISAFSIKYFGFKSKQSMIALNLLILVLIEGVLGGITVLTELAWWVRLIHLGVSFIIIYYMAYLYSITKSEGTNNSFIEKLNPNKEKALYFLLPSVFILMLYGSVIVGLGANSSCMSWPDCMGQWVSFKDHNYLTHMLHRYLALFIGILILYAAHFVGRSSAKKSFVKNISRSLSIMFVLQIIFSVLLVTTGFGNWLRIVHLSFAAAIWLFCSWLYIEYRLFVHSKH